MHTYFTEDVNEDQRIWCYTPMLKRKKRTMGKVAFLTQNKIWPLDNFSLDRSSLENLFNLIQLRASF